MLVVDAGFSFTHIVPIMGGAVLWSAVKRCVDSLAVAVHRYESMQDRCWWEAPDKSSQRARFISSMEHDGRDTHYE